MSRVGKRPIDIPKGITVKIDGKRIQIEGKGKTFEYLLDEEFTAKLEKDKIFIECASRSHNVNARHGTTRSLLQNIITGIKDGFQKKLEIQGVGYKAEVKGKNLVLDVGFSHIINFTPPEGITIETPVPTEIIIKGMDKQKVGEVAAMLRSYYPPEPYKGKGIRYAGEYVRQKQGKSIA